MIGGLDQQLRSAPIISVVEPGRSPLYLCVVDVIEVGRDCGGIVLADPAISRRHIGIAPSQGAIAVTDLGSMNGVYVNGRKINDTVQLLMGDNVSFGKCMLRIARLGGTTGPGVQAVNEPQSRSDMRATSIDLVAGAVLDNGARQAQPPDPGTVTIVFSDIEDSTATAVALGDVRWHEVLSVHNQIMRRMLARHNGTETHCLGDGFMMCFRSARSAINFIIDAQRALAAYQNANPSAGLRVRAGVHTGEAVLSDDGDLFGRHVIMASRIADQAKGGEILVSSLVREIVEPRGEVEFAESLSVSLKGLKGEHLLHKIRYL